MNIGTLMSVRVLRSYKFSAPTNALTFMTYCTIMPSMKYATTITKKHQVHIPSAVRKQIGLVKHGRARIFAERGRIVIEPVHKGILSLEGAFRVRKPIPAERIRKHIAYVEGKK